MTSNVPGVLSRETDGLPDLTISFQSTECAGRPAAKSDIPLACYASETIFAAAEKCIDSATDTCFVIDDSQRLIGSISLQSIRRAILEGNGIDNDVIAHH